MGVGLDAQWMLAEEATWGTFIAPNRSYEFSSESLQLGIEREEFFALKAPNRVIKTGRWVSGKRGAGGAIETAVMNKGQGLLWKHAFGAIVTTTPTNGILTRDHTATPGDLLGKGLTVQIGRPDLDSSTLVPFTYTGCKVAAWELSCAVGGFAALSFDLVGKDEETGQTLGTWTPPAALKAMPWTGATLTIAAGAVNVSEVAIRGENALSDDRFILGSNFRREPLETQLREYTGTMSADFDSLTAYNRFVNGTEATLVITLQGDQIEAVTPTYYFSTIITANVRFDGETPTVEGPEEMRQPLGFKVVDTGSVSISLVYRTTDTSP